MADPLRTIIDNASKGLSELDKQARHAAFNVKAWSEAASPVAVNTLMDSIQLVEMSLGAAFLPAILESALYIQHFADAINNLDPEWKTLIEQIGVAAVVIGTFTAALLALTAIIGTIAAAFSGGVALGIAALVAAAGVGIAGGYYANKLLTPHEREPGEKGLLAHFAKEAQPRIGAVEDFRKQLQLSALKDPLEQAIIQKLRDNYQKLAEIANNTARPVGLR